MPGRCERGSRSCGQSLRRFRQLRSAGVRAIHDNEQPLDIGITAVTLDLVTFALPFLMAWT
jgi:hypothetical protein